MSNAPNVGTPHRGNALGILLVVPVGLVVIVLVCAMFMMGATGNYWAGLAGGALLVAWLLSIVISGVAAHVDP